MKRSTFTTSSGNYTAYGSCGSRYTSAVSMMLRQQDLLCYMVAYI